MITKRRPILFEVLGERGSASRRLTERSAPGLSSVRENAAGVVAVLLVVGVILAGAMYWKFAGKHAPRSDSGAPLLQSNADVLATPESSRPASSQLPPDAYAILACDVAYKNAVEKKSARARATELLDFLGTVSDPEFRFPCAANVAYENKSGQGEYQVFVGSSPTRKDLESLRQKLQKLEYPRGKRPFAGAHVALAPKH